MKNRGIRYGFFFLTAVILTWPLILHLPTHLPLGTETAATVPLFNLWMLIWNAQALAHGYAGYWNAPIFYPEPGAFALSDPQPLTGAIFALPYFLFRNPVLAYNLVFLGFLTLNGVAGGGLHPWPLSSERERGENILMGLFAQSLPFVTREWGVLQLVAVFPVIFALRAVRRFGETPSLRAGLTLGAWVAVTFLTSSYYGLFLVLVLPLGVMFARQEHFRGRAVFHLLAGVTLAGAVLWPVLSAQRQLTETYTRSESAIQNNSAWGVDYLRLDKGMWGEEIMPWLRTAGGSGQRLYPGTGLLILAGVGAAWGWRCDKRWVSFCLLGAMVAMGISFGAHLEIGGVQPYAWVREFVPGFEQLRSPFRMGVLVQVFLLGLAGVGVRALPNFKDRFWVVALLGVASVAEVVAFPAQIWTHPALRSPPGWVDWLAGQPAGAVALLPFPDGGTVKDFEPTALGMVLAQSYGKPLVNGYSGFFPQRYRDLNGVVRRQFPNEISLARLREAGVRYLIVERDWLTAEDEAVIFGLGVEWGWEGEETVVFVMP